MLPRMKISIVPAFQIPDPPKHLSAAQMLWEEVGSTSAVVCKGLASTKRPSRAHTSAYSPSAVAKIVIGRLLVLPLTV